MSVENESCQGLAHSPGNQLPSNIAKDRLPHRNPARADLLLPPRKSRNNKHHPDQHQVMLQS